MGIYLQKRTVFGVILTPSQVALLEPKIIEARDKLYPECIGQAPDYALEALTPETSPNAITLVSQEENTVLGDPTANSVFGVEVSEPQSLNSLKKVFNSHCVPVLVAANIIPETPKKHSWSYIG